MVTCVPFAGLLAEPNLFSEQTDEILFGEQAEILEENGSFYRVRTEYGYFGWTEKSNFELSDYSANYSVAATFADLLVEPKNCYRAFSALPRGARIYAENIENARYLRAFTPNGKAFYIHKNHIAPIRNCEKSEAGIRESLAATAKEYLGVQYRWGGRTHLGIDCSGLCFNAYRFNGIDIWRDAHIEKSPKLRKIGMDEAKIGDLIFFKGHVAMYLGDGMIIHSTASRGRVVTEKLYENEYLKEIYICAGTAY